MNTGKLIKSINRENGTYAGRLDAMISSELLHSKTFRCERPINQTCGENVGTHIHEEG